MKRNKKPSGNWIQRNWIGLVICIYQGVLLIFLFAELGVPFFSGFRATNQVLLLLALLFLPFVLIASASVIKTIRVSLQGHDVEVVFGRVQRLTRIGEDLGGRLGDSEQVLGSLLAGPDPDSGVRLARGEILIGAKEFKSSRFLAHLMAHWIRQQSAVRLVCRPCWPNGSTLKNYADLKNGRIDLYVEYTGTGCHFLGIPPGKDSTTTIEALNQFTVPRHGIRWLEPIGTVDNFRLVVRREFAEERRLKTIHDLSARADTMTFCSVSEFFSRRDGFNGLCRQYRLRFKHRELCGYDDNYDRLESGEVDVIIGWDSDSRLKQTDLFTTLDDVEHYFPDYHAVPLVRVEALERVPDLHQALAALKNKVPISVLQNQCGLLDIRGDDPAVYDDIAKDFIRDVLNPADKK